jgi:O-antigen/teichoic acid export membrane protein
LRIKNNSFLFHVWLLVGSASLGQIVNLIAAPIISRLYGPTEFGVLAEFSAITGILGVICTLNYQSAIPVCESDKEGSHVVLLGTISLLSFVLLISIVLNLFGNEISDLLKTPQLKPYICYLPLSILFTGSFVLTSFWAIRKEAFKLLANANFFQMTISTLLKICMSFLGAEGLIIGYLASLLLGIERLLPLTTSGRGHVFTSCTFSELVAVAKKYISFPLYSAPGILLDTIGQQLPPLIFASAFGPDISGVYLFANQILMVPISLVGRAISNVFFSKASKITDGNQISQLVSSMNANVAYLILPPTVLLYLAGQDLFSHIFGYNWRLSGRFSEYMAPSFYFIFLNTTIAPLFYILDKQHYNFLFNLGLIFLRTAAIFLGVLYNSPSASIIAFSAVSAIIYAVSSFVIMRYAGLSIKNNSAQTLRGLVHALVIVSPLVLYHLLPRLGGFDPWFLGLLATLFLLGIHYIKIFRNSNLEDSIKAS